MKTYRKPTRNNRKPTRNNREQACQTWRHAAKMQREAIGIPACVLANNDEQEAWDYYAEICDQRGECVEPGCYVKSPDHVNCERHRTR